ncbi:MFS transporter [Fodinicola acaciae]|uniref:MFS transporter n=1 Tax=Fodinicola acaciae TaxID=2681555 RepID=UPI001FE96365|nr:MFS transporter [Fodinicola acaciae]
MTTLETNTRRWDARLWGVLLVVCTVVALDALDVSMVGVALPAIRADLGMSTSSLQWVVSGYVLGYGGLLLLGGRAADLLGRRRVLLIALGVFTAASLLGGLVSDGTLLIAARFIKGMAAAFTAPAALSIVTTTFPEGHARNRALSIFGVFGASGYSLGLVFSGLMTQVGWRWTFLLPVPIALATLYAAYRLVPRTARPARTGQGYDVVGAVLGVAASMLLVFTVVSAPEAGWASVRTIGGLVLSVALAVTFVVVERRSPHPLLRLGILRAGALRRANLGVIAFFGGYISFQFVVMLYLQSVRQWSPLQTALAFLPAALIVAFGSPRTAWIVDRVGTAPTIAAGVLAHVAGYLLFFDVGIDSNYFTTVLPSMLLLGVGFMLAFPAFNIQATSGISDDEQGLAGGLLNTSVQVGGAVVLAIVTAVVTASGGAQASAAALLAGFRPALYVVTGVSVLGLAVAVMGLVAHRRAVVARRRAGSRVLATGGAQTADPTYANAE